jgi:hypothetical protein
MLRQILGIVNVRYESGLTLQGTTFAVPFLASSESLTGADLGVVAPIWKGTTVRLAAKSVLDRNCSYRPDFLKAEAHRFLNFCCRFWPPLSCLAYFNSHGPLLC